MCAHPLSPDSALLIAFLGRHVAVGVSPVGVARTCLALSSLVGCAAGEPARPSGPLDPPFNAAFNPTLTQDAGSSPDGDSDAATSLDSGAEASCTQDLLSCPSSPPSWASEVQAIINLRCNACHGVGGIEQSKWNFSTYQGVHNNFGSVLNQIYGCTMPPADAAAPTPDERLALLEWLVCRAPNN
jgi:hypothetical protein